MGERGPNGGLYSLEDLGIAVVQDAYGKDQFSINLKPHALFGTSECRAVYDEQTKRWRLKASPDMKLGGVDHVWKPEDFEDPSTGREAWSEKWVQNLPKTEHVDAMLSSVDWSATPLGPLAGWPTSLQVYLNIILADNMAAIVYWGPELCAIFNEQMANIVAGRLNKSTDLQGAPFSRLWPELWEDFEPMFKSVAAKRRAIETIDVTLFPRHNGLLEETFWTGSFLPISDADGKVQGFYNRVRETTKEFLAERRTKVLTAIAATPELPGGGVWKHIFAALESNSRDIPMAFVYSAHEDVDTDHCTLNLEHSVGLPADGHPLVPKTASLYDGHAGFIPLFRKARTSKQPHIVHTSDGSLPPRLLDGFDWGGFGEPSRSLALLSVSTSDRLLGVLTMGLNPRRPFDKEYEGFLSSLGKTISAVVATAIDREETISRAERLRRQLEDSERQIRDLAEHGPVGIVRVAGSGKVTWANDQFFQITGHGKQEEDQYEMSFLDIVHPDDRATCAESWRVLNEQHRSTTIAVRVKREWQPPSNSESEPSPKEPAWVLASAYPNVEDGQVKSIAAAVTDISHFKWAEGVQSRNAAAAKEAKRLQENFIDIVSHEMRNPLSAITQLSDAISGSMGDFQTGRQSVEHAQELLAANVDSANTILMCAAHQKRIIDDVLTLSKLDSMMLSITPVVVRPYEIVESVLRMFEGEFSTNKIEVRSFKEESYGASRVDWVCLDPSRLTQIFINLITNAIKFTKLEARREITIRTGAELKRPSTIAGVNWFRTNQTHRDPTVGPEWGQGEHVYLCFEVQDTGRGLEQQEMSKLFHRFQQATAKTHIKYGGSGLGLFISRELTETQGGEIGVVSELGKGSTFAFYVKGRRAEPPDEPARMLSPVTSRKASRPATIPDKSLVEPASLRGQPCVLMVEDNVVNAKVLTKQLERLGCEVYVANHGMEALDSLSKSRSWKGNQGEKHATDFDVVLMDVEMPIMDGLTCTRRIRQLEREGSLTKHVNIIVITANSRQEQMERVRQAGADEVLPKPFKVGECLEKINQVMAKKSG